MATKTKPNNAAEVADEMRRLEAEWRREDAELARKLDKRDTERKYAARAQMEPRPLLAGTPQKKAPATAPDAGDVSEGSMRGALGIDTLVPFIEAGNAVITIQSKTSGERLTFKFSRPKEDGGGLPGRPKPIWVSLLSGPNNDSDYQFMGTIWPEASFWTFKTSAKTRVSKDATSMKTILWFVKSLNMGPANIFRHADVYHEGRCGRCGRRLTVPESITSGFGPECITKM